MFVFKHFFKRYVPLLSGTFTSILEESLIFRLKAKEVNEDEIGKICDKKLLKLN
jgi:hypothetical protein